MNTSIELLLNDPEIKGTAFEKMLRRGFAMNDPKIKWDTVTKVQDFTNPFAKTYQDLNDEISRVYGEQLDATKQKADTTTMGNVADYLNTIESLNQSLKEDTDTLNDKEGMSGTWGSSARSERMNSLGSKYNTKYNTAYNTASTQAGLNGVNNQSQLGTNFYNPGVNKYQVNNGQVGQVGQTYKYNPFKQSVGGIEASKNYTLRQI